MMLSALDGYFDIPDRGERPWLDRAKPIRIKALKEQRPAGRDMPAARDKLRQSNRLFPHIDEIACKKHDVKSTVEREPLNVAADLVGSVRHMAQHFWGIVDCRYRVPIVKQPPSKTARAAAQVEDRGQWWKMSRQDLQFVSVWELQVDVDRAAILGDGAGAIATRALDICSSLDAHHAG